MALKLTFTKYCELVVARLYEMEKNESRLQADVAELMADLDGVVPVEWPREAAQRLVSSGLAADLGTQGASDVELNARGRLLAESGAGVIGDYRQSAQLAFTIDGNEVTVGHRQTISGDFWKEELRKLLHQAEAALEADTTVTDEDRQDAVADVESMRTQLAKTTPNRQALVALATGIASVASLADIGAKIRRLVG